MGFIVFFPPCFAIRATSLLKYRLAIDHGHGAIQNMESATDSGGAWLIVLPYAGGASGQYQEGGWFVADDEISSVQMNAVREIAEEETALSGKDFFWLGVTAVALLAVYLSPLGEHLTHLQEIRDELARTGAMAPFIFMIVMTSLTAVGFPRLLMYPIAGLVFGFFWGIAWSMVATVGGAYLTFCYARWGGRSLVQKMWPKVADVSRSWSDGGFMTVALLKQLPGPGFLLNLFFGISLVGHRAFLAGTALGSLPSAIPATLIGTSISHESTSFRLFSVITAILWLMALWMVCSVYLKRSSRFRTIAPH